MPSLSTYILLDVTLPAVLMAVICALTFVLTLLGILYKKFWKDNDDHPVPLVFLEMVDLAFPDLEKQKSDGYDVFGKGIKSYIFAILTMMIIPVIAATCFITFWNVYAVEEAVGGACVDNFDCFPRMSAHGEFLQQEPVASCSSFRFKSLDSQLNDSKLMLLLSRLNWISHTTVTALSSAMPKLLELLVEYWLLLPSFQRFIFQFWCQLDDRQMLMPTTWFDFSGIFLSGLCASLS